MIFTKWNFLDEVCIFRDSLMPEHQGIEKSAKIAKKNIFDFLSFWSGLNIEALKHSQKKRPLSFRQGTLYLKTCC